MPINQHMDTLSCKKILLFAALLFLQGCTNAVPKLSGLNIDFSLSNEISVRITNVAATSGSYSYGNTIDIQVTFSEAVSVSSGVPTLRLATGAVLREAAYISGSGSAVLTFRYTVGLGDSASDLQYVATDSLILNGSSITGSSDKTMYTSLPALESSSSLASTSNVIVNGSPVYFSLSNSTFGDTITAFTRRHLLTVQNSSASNVTISSMIITNNTIFNYSGGSYPGISGTCAAALTASSSCVLEVDFTPTSTGSFNTSFIINFTDSGTSLQNTFSMTGSASTNYTLAAGDLSGTYPAFSSIWNRYVRMDGTAACSVSDTQCIHAAERKTVQVPALNGSCLTLSASDSLSAFNWTCDDSTATSNGIIYFSTTSLASGKGLRDLIDGTGNWRSIVVNINIMGGPRNGQLYATRPSSGSWWTNTITQLPTNSGLSLTTLNTADTIYFTSANQTLNGGYRINADGISIVTLNGAKILQDGTTADTTAACNGSALTIDTRSMICSYLMKHLWIEADMDGNFNANGFSPNVANAAAVAVKFNDVTFSRINMSKFENFGTNGFAFSFPAVRLVNSSKNLLTKISVYNSYGGIYLSGENSLFSNNNILRDINISKINALSYATKAIGFSRANNNKAHDVKISAIYSNSSDATGVLIENGSSNNSLQRIMISNVSGYTTSGVSGSITNAYGIRINDAGSAISNNILSQITVFAIKGMGLLIESNSGISNTYVSQATISNNSTAGIKISGPSNNNAIFNNIVSINNEHNIMAYTAAAGSNASFYNVVATNSSFVTGNGAVYLDGYYNVNFNNYLITDPSGSNKCFKNASVSSNLSASNCSIGGSYQETTAMEAAQSFVGKVTQLSSPSDVNPKFPLLPVIYFTDIVTANEWLDFSNVFRSWGSDGSFGSTYPNSTQQGSCDTNSASFFSYFCNIWDWRIRQNSALNNRSTSYFTINSVETFTDGNCVTSQLNGSNTISMSGMDFMTYAIEINGDGIGNDNGLCEDNESCIYTPNLGSFQGQSTLLNPYCMTSTGLVTGAKIYKYSSSFAPTPY